MHLVGILADTLLHVSPIGLSMPTFRRPFGNPSAKLAYITDFQSIAFFHTSNPPNTLLINNIDKPR